MAQTNKQTHKQTDGHRDSMTESANSVKKKKFKLKKLSIVSMYWFYPKKNYIIPESRQLTYCVTKLNISFK